MSPTEAAVPISVAIAASYEAAIAAALAAIQAMVGCPDVVLVDPAIPPDAGKTIAAVTRQGLACTTGSLADPPAGTGWTRRLVPAGAARFSSVMVPTWAGEASVALIVRAPDAGSRPASPFELLARQSPLRQRLAARLAPQPRQAVAELASVWRVDLVLLVGRDAPLSLAVATPSLLAAELAWLALRPASRPDVAPWEDAGIQGAAALGMPPLAPTHLRLFAATPDASSLVESLGPRLGV